MSDLFRVSGAFFVCLCVGLTRKLSSTLRELAIHRFVGRQFIKCLNQTYAGLLLSTRQNRVAVLSLMTLYWIEPAGEDSSKPSDIPYNLTARNACPQHPCVVVVHNLFIYLFICNTAKGYCARVLHSGLHTHIHKRIKKKDFTTN